MLQLRSLSMPARDEHREADGWRRSAVSKLQEAPEAIARGHAEPAVAAEVDDDIARLEHRSRTDTSYLAST
jgi:hypothetical protein